jgi:hypothetical protein
MGLVGRVTLVVMLAGAVGCSRSERGVQGRKLPASVLSAKPIPVHRPESIYDAHGNLKPSATSVGWLEIPMGLTERKARGTQHVFGADELPLKALTRFLDARVLTADLQVTPSSVRYGRAQPKNQAPQNIALDIALYTNASGSHVDLLIDERPRTVGAPMTAEDLRSLINQKQARAE